MTELIKIEDQNGIKTVNAKNLHIYLGNKDRFDQWIRRRIEKYDFVLNQDFCTKMCKTSGRPYTEYYIGIDMAKELCMVENNDKGKEMRRYFIEVEKRARHLSTPKLSDDEMIRNAMMILDGRVKKLEAKIKRIKIKCSSSTMLPARRPL